MAGFEPAHQVRLDLMRDQDAAIEAFEAHYRKSGRLVVTVLDAASGLPLAGARVTLDGGSAQRERTGADGKARFAGLPRGVYNLAADLTGYAGARRDRFALPAPGEERQERAITLRLAADAAGTVATTPVAPLSSAIVVTVLDQATGKPIPGASVRLDGVDGTGRSAATGVDGRAGFTQLSEGIYTLRALHPGHVGQSRERLAFPSPAAEPGKPETRAFTFRLEPVLVSHLSLSVTDSVTGAPLGGAAVLLATPDHPRRLKVGEDGHLTIRDLPAGEYRLTVTAEGHAPGSRAVKLPAEPRAGEEVAVARIAMALEPARLSTLLVTLRDEASGKPVAGAQVVATGAGERFAQPSGAGGVARIEGLPPGVFAVHVSAKGYEPRRLSDLRLPVGEQGPSLRRVSVTLLQATGKAQEGSTGGSGATQSGAAQGDGSKAGKEANAAIAVCNAYVRLVQSKPDASVHWALSEYRGIRIGGGRLTGGQCVVSFSADYLHRGQWVHLTDQKLVVPVEGALKDLEKHAPATGRSLRSLMSGASTASGAGGPISGPAAPQSGSGAAGDPCAGVRGMPRPDSTDSKAILNWVRCNGMAPAQLSPDQIRLRNQQHH
jgi:5-hydroxyisourate hydrolase-like protein (transthyretin family)